MECHGIKISRESVRQIMLHTGLWRGRSKRIQQMRVRRPCFGELLQIDGSLHDWFEGRSALCCLIVFVDDATSQLVALHFVETECMQGYFQATQQHLAKHGRPLAYYSDKHGIFRVNQAEAESGTGETQYGRACRHLGIELIHANSPQAKGRVERANKTLQDRLVKELRLHNINDINTANNLLPEFIKAYNQRFASEPASPVDAHRTDLPTPQQLDLIFSEQHERGISKQLEISYHNKIYQIQTKTPCYNMRNAKLTVCDNQGTITLLYKGKALQYKVFDKKNRPPQIVNFTVPLKHTFGQRLRAAGVSFEDRQDLLGHKSQRITTHYSTAKVERLIDAANKVIPHDDVDDLSISIQEVLIKAY